MLAYSKTAATLLSSFFLSGSAAQLSTDTHKLSSPMTLGEATSILPQLEKPIANYFKKGGHYIEGPNDCSTFLSDYCNSSGFKISRKTTEDLANTDKLDSWHVTRTEFQPENIVTGRCVIFRYKSPKSGKMCGHCGVIICRMTGEEGKKIPFVIHNSESNKGLKIDYLADFLATAQRLDAQKNFIVDFSTALSNHK